VPDVVAAREEAGQRLAAANAARAEALDDIGVLLRQGHNEVPITTMSKAAGISRVTAYKLLEEIS
jgi:hypothetical protein